MRANTPRRNNPILKRNIKQEVKEQLTKQYAETYADCAADIMQQTLANVLLCLERNYGFGKKRLTDFVHTLQMWCDVMDSPTERIATWTTEDNIAYFAEKYGIDLRKEFQAEVK